MPRHRESLVTQGSPLWGILAGLFVDVLGFSLILNMPTIYFAMYVTRNWTKDHGINGQELATVVMAEEFAIARIVFALIAGLAPSFVGGYIFARIARSSNFRLASLLSCTSAISVYLIHGFRDYTLSYDYKSYDSHSTLMQVLVTGLTVAGVLLGAKYGMRKARRQA